VSPSVVQIETSEGLGSGIVFDAKGDIVTNYHVVGTAKTFTVTTYAPARRLTGKLVGTFPADDLAVIKVNSNALRPAAFADSSKLRVGEIAMAVGNPLGLSSSVTEGIVSALGRQEPEGNGVVLQNAIQTSAAINPGNSGGALVNIRGSVIGIPTLGAADPQLGGAAAGIGFAIPSNTVKNIASQIIQHGHVVSSGRPYLGIQVGDTGNGVYVGEGDLREPGREGGAEGRRRDPRGRRQADGDLGRPRHRAGGLQAGADGDAQSRPPERLDRERQGDAVPVPRHLGENRHVQGLTPDVATADRTRGYPPTAGCPRGPCRGRRRGRW
jgi:trypsin-like peptidase